MKHLSLLLLAIALSSCASGPKPGEPAIPTTATGTVTVTSVSTATSAPAVSTGASASQSTIISTSTSTATGTATSATARDVIAGQVVGEEPMMQVSKHANVRLLQKNTELANITAEPDGSFRFEGTFEKGRYEILVRDGMLHGAREISFSGGQMMELSVVVTDGKGDKHHRRRRKRH